MNVRQTSLTTATGRKLYFLGLFAERDYDIGEVIGQYSGRSLTFRDFKRTLPEERVYAYHLKRNMYIVPELGPNHKPDCLKYTESNQ